MLRIDTLKMILPPEAISEIATERMLFQPIISGATGESISEKGFINNPGVGIKRVELNKQTGEVIAEVSGKCLGSDYFDLININTIEKVFDSLNSCSPVTFIPGKAIESAKVLTMDCTNNLKVSAPIDSYLTALNQIRVNDRYNVTDYRKPGNKGVVIAGKQKSFKERQIFYHKSLDIQRDKALKEQPYYEKVKSDHQNVLRVEGNFTSLERIRHYTGGTTNLVEILRSGKNPNLTLFEKVTKKNSDCQLLIELQGGKYAGMTLHQLEKRKGMEGIIRESNFDMNIILMVIRETRSKGSNNSKVIRNYRALLSELIESESEGSTVKRNILIEEIRQLLKAS